MFKKWIAAVIITLASGVSARADFTIMDQIGPNSSFTDGQAIFASQKFEPSSAAFDIATVDNFTLTATTTIDQVQAAVALFDLTVFSSIAYSSVTDWEVAIYSSPAAAISSLTGDVADVNVSPADVTGLPLNGELVPGLATIPVSITLGAGTYYLAVIPSLSFFPFGQIGIEGSDFAGFPGGQDAFQVNPAGGFGFTGAADTNADAGYRITGFHPPAVPEPSSILLLSTGLGVVLTAGHRRLSRRP